jgi:hypothetical protein
MSTHPAFRLVSLITAAALALAGCSDGTRPVPVLTASAVPGGDGQSTVAGVALPQPLRVLVEEDGTPKEGVTVTWTVSAGAVTLASSLTDATGVAATSWTLGSTPGAMTATATVAGAKGSPVIFSAAALTRPGMVASIADGDRQAGQVGAPLPTPLRVRVQTFGPTNAGVTVFWSPTDGHATPTSSVTDAAGYATTSWTLDTVAQDNQRMVARISGAEGSPLTFTARALAGAAVRMIPMVGDSQTSHVGAAYNTPFAPLLAAVVDRYGNRLPYHLVTWSVVSGPVHIVSANGATDNYGTVSAQVAPEGPSGAASVQVTESGSNRSATFALTVAPLEHFVAWVNGAFTSGANGSKPAVDTITVGTTMTWLYLDGDPYDGPEIFSEGTPSFSPPPLDLYYGKASFTFTTPGSYSYTGTYSSDYFGEGDTTPGTLVVR